MDPSNTTALNVLRFIAEEKKIEISLYLISQEMFNEMAEQYSGGTKQAIKEVLDILSDEESDKESPTRKEDENDKESIQSAPVAKLLSVIIRHAIEGNASDIHI